MICCSSGPSSCVLTGRRRFSYRQVAAALAAARSLLSRLSTIVRVREGAALRFGSIDADGCSFSLLVRLSLLSRREQERERGCAGRRFSYPAAAASLPSIRVREGAAALWLC